MSWGELEDQDFISSASTSINSLTLEEKVDGGNQGEEELEFKPASASAAMGALATLRYFILFNNTVDRNMMLLRKKNKNKTQY